MFTHFSFLETLHSCLRYLGNIGLLCFLFLFFNTQTAACLVVLFFSFTAPGLSDVCTAWLHANAFQLGVCAATQSVCCTHKCSNLCRLHLKDDDRWSKCSRSLETCHNVRVYTSTTRRDSRPRARTHTRPSASKFITVHHLPTCSVMTFSQSHKKIQGNLWV